MGKEILQGADVRGVDLLENINTKQLDTDVQAKMHERLDIIEDAINCKKPKRIPTLASMFTWRIFDSDLHVPLSVATSNWDIMGQIVCECQERYNFDLTSEYGLRNDTKTARILGGLQHIINDETGAVYALDHVILKTDEYDEYIKNPIMFFWTKVAERKFGNLTFGQIEDAIKAIVEKSEYNKKINDIFLNRYGVPPVSKGAKLFPIEAIFANLRGIKEFSVDLRRQPEKLSEFVAATEPAYLAAVDQLLDGNSDGFACDLSIAALVHSVLNRKQFEQYYWTTFKKVIDKLVAKRKKIYAFMEADMLRFADFFDDVPSGVIMMALEKDNIFEAKDRLPNICVAGGMPVTLLGHGTKQECVNYSHKLIDELGDRGFIFSTDKMLSFKNDAMRENLLAVQEFVLNYRV